MLDGITQTVKSSRSFHGFDNLDESDGFAEHQVSSIKYPERSSQSGLRTG